MTAGKLHKCMQVFVPVTAAVIILGDVVLEACWGAPATYTSVIRQAIYYSPAFTVAISAAMGALWAHFCWTPGAAVEAMRAELLSRYRMIKYWEEVDKSGYRAAAIFNDGLGIHTLYSPHCLTMKDAWQCILQMVRRDAKLHGSRDSQKL